MRRTAAFIIAILLSLGITASAATTTLSVEDILPVTDPANTTADTTGTLGGDNTTDTTNTTGTNTTTTAPTTTTTTKPTDKRVKSVLYAQKKLPAGAVMHGKMQWETGRNDGAAMRFNGTDAYLEINAKQLDSPFTLSLWVNWYADISHSDALDQRLFSFVRKNTENSICMTPFTKQQNENGDFINGIAVMSACYQKGWTRENLYYASTNVISNHLPTDTWHHVAMTVEEDTVTVYIDGMQWKRQTLPFAFEDLQVDSLLIGADNNGVCLFTGLMQEVRLYEKALTPSQVLRIAKDIDPFDATLTDTPAMYLPVPLPQTVALQQNYRITSSLENNTLGLAVTAEPNNTFLNSPALSGGQSATCTIAVENKAKKNAGVSLKAICLPQQGTPAWLYLSEITVTVKSGEDILYTGAYTDMTPETLKLQTQQLPYNGITYYTVTLSRPFTAKTAYAACDVTWQFDCTALPITDSALPPEQPLGWLIVLLILSVFAVGFCIYWAITKAPNRWGDSLVARIASLRRTPSVQPAEESEAISADAKDLPADDISPKDETE